MFRKVGKETPIEPKARTSQNLQESGLAIQKLSQGGLLGKRSGWQWFVFIITFQWVKAAFTHKKEKQEALSILKETAELGNRSIFKKLNLSQLKKLVILINEIPEVKTYLAEPPASSFNKKVLTLLADPQKACRVFQIVKKADSLLKEPLSVEEASKNITGLLENTSFEELNTFETFFNEPPQVEKRNERLHITNPQTQETRTLDQEISEQAQQAPSSELTQQPEIISGGSALSDQEMIEWLKKGNIYAVEIEGHSYLSLCPRPIELVRASFLNLQPISEALMLIKEGKSGEISIPIGDPLGKKVGITVERTANTCTVTATYENFSYPITYALKENETLPELAVRLASTKTLERDLLLARSFFVRETIK